MNNKLQINNFINSKNKLKLIQKAILTGIGVAASKDAIKRAASGIYSDVQKIIKDLLGELEKKGDIKAKEAKKIVQQLQKKSESEKARIYKKLQKEGKTLLKSVREILITPVTILKETSSSLKLKKNSKKRISSKKITKKKRRK